MWVFGHPKRGMRFLGRLCRKERYMRVRLRLRLRVAKAKEISC